MSATIIDGKMLAEKLKEKAREIVLLMKEEKLNPRLCVIMVGNDPASSVYVRQKEKACAEIGLESIIERLPEECSQQSLEAIIDQYVEDEDTAGVMLQLPVPPHIDVGKAMKHIPAYKDVDGFGVVNTGHLWLGHDVKNYPCTPAGIMFALKETGIDLAGKNVVIVGRSNIVGKPLAALMLNENATVTICHSKTQCLSHITARADVLISAVGIPNFIKWHMVKRDAVVIDVGINRVNGKLCGDVDYDNVKEVASYITPVPGGIGPLTVAQLMLNTAQSAWQQRDIMRFKKTHLKGVLEWAKSLSQETSMEVTKN